MCAHKGKYINFYDTHLFEHSDNLPLGQDVVAGQVGTHKRKQVLFLLARHAVFAGPAAIKDLLEPRCRALHLPPELEHRYHVPCCVTRPPLEKLSYNLIMPFEATAGV